MGICFACASHPLVETITDEVFDMIQTLMVTDARLALKCIDSYLEKTIPDAQYTRLNKIKTDTLTQLLPQPPPVVNNIPVTVNVTSTATANPTLSPRLSASPSLAIDSPRNTVVSDDKVNVYN